LASSANNGKHALFAIQRALLADKYQYIYSIFVSRWRVESFSVTCFDEYSFISNHTDFVGNPNEEYKLTIILYLTPEITESDGGYLVFHSPAGKMNIWLKVNRLVLFMPSSKIVHEVRPDTRGNNVPRLAISGWLI